MSQQQKGEKLSDLMQRFLSPSLFDRKTPATKRLIVGYSEAKAQSKKENHHAA